MWNTNGNKSELITINTKQLPNERYVIIEYNDKVTAHSSTQETCFLGIWLRENKVTITLSKESETQSTNSMHNYSTNN